MCAPPRDIPVAPRCTRAAPPASALVTIPPAYALGDHVKIRLAFLDMYGVEENHNTLAPLTEGL